MGSGPTVVSPDGARWKVRRRWLERPLADLRRRIRERRREIDAGDALDAIWVLDGVDSLGVAISLSVAAILVVVVLLPLLGIALELVVVLVVVAWGAFARIALRRPWVIEARNLDDATRSSSYAVPGWRASGRAIEELRAAIAVGGPPDADALHHP
jgi:hypothetical protein